jgi:hypothetical protein
MKLEFVSLRAFGSEDVLSKDKSEELVGRQNLAKALVAEKVESKYRSIAELSDKILKETDDATGLKLEGFVVRNPDNKQILGFVLYTKDTDKSTLSDMFKFQAGKHKRLFTYIGDVLSKTIGWEGDLSEDGNNVKMIPSFSKARPLFYDYTIKL